MCSIIVFVVITRDSLLNLALKWVTISYAQSITVLVHAGEHISDMLECNREQITITNNNVIKQN